MKKYIMAAALALVFSSAVSVDAWARLCSSGGKLIRCNDSRPISAQARVGQNVTPGGDLGSEAIDLATVIHKRKMTIENFYRANGKVGPDTDWYTLGFESEREFLVLVTEVKTVAVERRRWADNAYRSGSRNLDFNSVYGRLAFGSPDALMGWYYGYVKLVDGYVRGQQGVPSFAGDNPDDWIVLLGTERDAIIRDISDLRYFEHYHSGR